jgi:hypothetical protein
VAEGVNLEPKPLLTELYSELSQIFCGMLKLKHRHLFNTALWYWDVPFSAPMLLIISENRFLVAVAILGGWMADFWLWLRFAVTGLL